MNYSLFHFYKTNRYMNDMNRVEPLKGCCSSCSSNN